MNNLETQSMDELAGSIVEFFEGQGFTLLTGEGEQEGVARFVSNGVMVTVSVSAEKGGE